MFIFDPKVKSDRNRRATPTSEELSPPPLPDKEMLEKLGAYRPPGMGQVQKPPGLNDSSPVTRDAMREDF